MRSLSQSLTLSLLSDFSHLFLDPVHDLLTMLGDLIPSLPSPSIFLSSAGGGEYAIYQLATVYGAHAWNVLAPSKATIPASALRSAPMSSDGSDDASGEGSDNSHTVLKSLVAGRSMFSLVFGLNSRVSHSEGDQRKKNDNDGACVCVCLSSGLFVLTV